MRQYERYPVQADVSFEILDKKTKGEGLLREISLSSGFIEYPRNIPLNSWLRIRIAPPKQPSIQTMGHVLRLGGGGFALHFNWLDREQLGEFGRFLKDHAPGSFQQALAGRTGTDNSSSGEGGRISPMAGSDASLDILYRRTPMPINRVQTPVRLVEARLSPAVRNRNTKCGNGRTVGLASRLSLPTTRS